MASPVEVVVVLVFVCTFILDLLIMRSLVRELLEVCRFFFGAFLIFLISFIEINFARN